MPHNDGSWRSGTREKGEPDYDGKLPHGFADGDWNVAM